MNWVSGIAGFATAVLASLAWASAAHAQGRTAGASAQPGKLYVGGAIGGSGFDADFERTKAVVRSTGATEFVVNANATDTMWKAYVGYRILPSFSVEAGYWNFGRVDTSTAITAPATATLQRDYRADGYGASAVFWVPMQGNLTGLVKAGAVRTTAKASASNPGAGLTPLPAETARKLNANWGLGLEYRFTRNLAARFEFENVIKVGDDAKFGTADIVTWGVGANYRF